MCRTDKSQTERRILIMSNNYPLAGRDSHPADTIINGVVGRIGKTIPITPIPKKIKPKIIHIRLIVCFITTSS